MNYPEVNADKNQRSTSVTPSSSESSRTPLIPLRYGPHEMKVLCPYCNAQVTTSVEYSAGLFSFVAAYMLMIMGCFCGCCLVPCCSEGFKNAEHTCPKCTSYLGTYHRC